MSSSLEERRKRADEAAERLMVTWANSQYKRIGAKIETLDVFADGEPLLVLMELLFLPASKQTQAKKVAANDGKPTMKNCTNFRKIEMIQKALAIATDAGVRFRFISAENFLEKNKKMMLAFCYASALRFNTRGLVEDTEEPQQSKKESRSSEKDLLLAWVKERISSYGVPVTDFTNSWLDGRAFLALVHSLCGGLEVPAEPAPFDFKEAESKGSNNDRLEDAFNKAEEFLKVQPLICALDVEERNQDAIVMYVSELSRALREHDDARDSSMYEPEPEPEPEPAVKKVEMSQEEYDKLLAALESSKAKVNQLEGELQESRNAQTEKAHKHKKEKEEEVSKTAPADQGSSLAAAHTEEHKKVLKLREQLTRAIERVEELAESAAEDPDTVEDLPEELAWLLDTILQKDKEATSSAALMTQLEMQMTASGTSGDVFLTEAEKVEVNTLLQNVAEEENHALSQIHDVLQKLMPDIKGKPIEGEVERLRKLALIGAERARRTLNGAEEAARVSEEQAAKQKQSQEVAEAMSKTAVVPPTAPAQHPMLERHQSMPVVSLAAPVKRKTLEPQSLTLEQKQELDKEVDATPADAVALPVVVEKFDNLEQKLEKEEPQLTEHVEAMKGTRSRAKEALRSTKAALSKAFHITKKAERRQEVKKKKAAKAMAVPNDGTDLGKLRATMITAIDTLMGDVSGDKRKLKERKKFIEMQGDDFLIKFSLLITEIQKQMLKEREEKIMLQGQLVDAQTKVWERVKQLRK